MRLTTANLEYISDGVYVTYTTKTLTFGSIRIVKRQIHDIISLVGGAIVWIGKTKHKSKLVQPICISKYRYLTRDINDLSICTLEDFNSSI